MNYKQACLNPTTTNTTNYIAPPIVPKACDDKSKFNRSCERAVRTLYLRWAQYKADYIELHGEDMYNYIHLTPNYWVMPEDEDLEIDGQQQQQQQQQYDDDDYYDN